MRDIYNLPDKEKKNIRSKFLKSEFLVKNLALIISKFRGDNEDSDELINAACSRAILFNSITYKTVKNILQKNIDTSIIPSSSYVSNEENSFKRDLSKYNKFLEGGNKTNE